MPTLIDALIVSLNLDATGFKKGTDETNKSLDETKRRSDTAARGISESQSKTQDAFRDTGSHATSAADAIEKGAARSHTAVRQLDTGITAASKSINEAGKVMLAPFAELALGVGAAVLSIDGIKKAISGAINQAGADSAQGRAASMSGIPIAAYSSFGSAVQSLGGDKSAAEQTLSNFSMQQQAAVAGQISPAMKLLEQLGIHPNQSITDIMAQLNQRFQGMSKAQATYVSGLLGLDPGTTYMLEQTPAKYRAALQAGAADQITPAQQAAEQGITGAYAGVLQALDNLGRDVTADSAPNLIRLLDGIKDFIGWLDGQAVPTIAKAAQAGWDAATGNPTSQSGLAAKAATYSTLVAAGLPKDVAAGIMGNAQRESSWNIGARNRDATGGMHYGLYQMSEDLRSQALKGTGIDVATADASGQTTAMLWLLKNRYQSVYQRLLSNPHGAFSAGADAGIFGTGFERFDTNSSPNFLERTKRWLSAQNIYATYAGSRGGGMHHHEAAQINVTVHVPSGDPHTIAHVVKRELQKAGAKASNSAGGAVQ